MQFWKTLSADEEVVIPKGLNAGYIENTAGTVTIKPCPSYGGLTNENETLSAAGDKLEVPTGADISGLVVSAGASSGAKIRLYRVGGKPESDEGRTK